MLEDVTTGRLPGVSARIVPLELGLAEAAAIIRSGGLVAFPTETVYGLGANALDEAAVNQIFVAKGRPSSNPVIVHVSSFEEARRLSSDWTQLAERLATRFWPGPLTLVVKAGPAVPGVVTAGGTTVGIRMPSHEGALALLRLAGVPIAAPSANRSECISPTTASHVQRGFARATNDLLILDGGACTVGIESTVVDTTGDIPIILRLGEISHAELGSIDALELAPPCVPSEPARSPGQRKRHYAPNCPVRCCEGPALRGTILPNTWILSIGETEIQHVNHIHVGRTVREVCARLYAAFHTANDAGASEVIIMGLPSESMWDAVRDRINRACASVD